MLLISKKQLVQTTANLGPGFLSVSVFKSRLQVGQPKLYGVSLGLVHIKTISVFLTRVQSLAETLLRKIRRGKFQ